MEKKKIRSKSFSEEAEINKNFCATCHLTSGEGIPTPSLLSIEYNPPSEKRIATIKEVKYGLKGNINVKYDRPMPPMSLKDEEVKKCVELLFYA